MALNTNISSGLVELSTAVKAARVRQTGSSQGDLSGLATTDKTSIIAALNELKGLVDSALTSSGAIINDAVNSESATHSSAKIVADRAADIQAAIDTLTGAAGMDLNTLEELANAIANDANAFATLTASIATKANSADVYTRAEIGDVNTDFVAIVQAALA